MGHAMQSLSDHCQDWWRWQVVRYGLVTDNASSNGQSGIKRYAKPTCCAQQRFRQLLPIGMEQQTGIE